MKLCSCCLKQKPVAEFYKDRTAKDGYSYQCKDCKKERQYAFNEKNQERRQKVQQKYFQQHKSKFLERNRRRYASQKKATPFWLTAEDIVRMRCYYQVAQMRNSESDVKWHVDHIVPLRGKTVSGLHVPWNLQVIPARDNIRKGNKHDQGEW